MQWDKLGLYKKWDEATAVGVINRRTCSKKLHSSEGTRHGGFGRETAVFEWAHICKGLPLSLFFLQQAVLLSVFDVSLHTLNKEKKKWRIITEGTQMLIVWVIQTLILLLNMNMNDSHIWLFNHFGVNSFAQGFPWRRSWRDMVQNYAALL